MDNKTKKYVSVLQENPGDRFEEVFESPEEANSAAYREWLGLSPKARAHCDVAAYVITEDNLLDGAIDEDTGEIDWRCFGECDTFPGAFDSHGADELLNAARQYAAQHDDISIENVIGWGDGIWNVKALRLDDYKYVWLTLVDDEIVIAEN